MKRKNYSEVIILLGAFLFVISLWIGCYFYVVSRAFDIHDKDLWTERAQFGDMFGAVSALFSGLAFAGILFTIYLKGRN